MAILHTVPARILIVEDDENLRITLEDNLVDEGYQVDTAVCGRDALSLLARDGYALVILDIMLPDLDGYQVCREIRSCGYPVAVLMLTARSLESDLVEGFEVGADDYLSKPYRLRELLARVCALLRRYPAAAGAGAGVAGEPAGEGSTAFGDYRLDETARTVTGPAGEVALTRTEFDLLACLLRHRGHAMSRQALLEAAWDASVVVEPRTVDNFVSNLKKKLGWREGVGFCIRTVRGVGYRMDVD